MWADNDSDDERPGFGGGKKKSDFTAPIGFVSGGIKQGDKTFKEGDEVQLSFIVTYYIFVLYICSAQSYSEIILESKPGYTNKL